MFSTTDAKALEKQLTSSDLSGPQTKQTPTLTGNRRHYGIDNNSLENIHSHRIGGDYTLIVQYFQLSDAVAGTAFLLHG